MQKILFNNKEEFQSWKEANSHHILIENDEEYPSNYPCLLVKKYTEIYYGDEDFVYYIFVYLDDFISDEKVNY